MKMLYKVEENLKQNNQKPQHGKTPLWWTKSKDTICPSKIPVSLRLSLSPKKRLEHQKNKQNPAVNPPPQNSTKPPECFTHIQSFCSNRFGGISISPD